MAVTKGGFSITSLSQSASQFSVAHVARDLPCSAFQRLSF